MMLLLRVMGFYRGFLFYSFLLSRSIRITSNLSERVSFGVRPCVSFFTCINYRFLVFLVVLLDASDYLLFLLIRNCLLLIDCSLSINLTLCEWCLSLIRYLSLSFVFIWLGCVSSGSSTPTFTCAQFVMEIFFELAISRSSTRSWGNTSEALSGFRVTFPLRDKTIKCLTVLLFDLRSLILKFI